MHFMDRRGSGLKKITDSTNQLFNDDKNHVDFYCKDNFFKVIIRNANYISDVSQNDDEKFIINAIKEIFSNYDLFSDTDEM